MPTCTSLCPCVGAPAQPRDSGPGRPRGSPLMRRVPSAGRSAGAGSMGGDQKRCERWGLDEAKGATTMDGIRDENRWNGMTRRRVLELLGTGGVALAGGAAVGRNRPAEAAPPPLATRLTREYGLTF